jgi:DNA-binding IclR family transcriptional regulator
MASTEGAGQVVHRLAQVLDCFTLYRPRLRASDIHQLTGLPTSTVARTLRTLVDEELLQRHGTVYSVGLRVTSWSAAATAGSDLLKVAAPLIEALRDDSGESCGLYVRRGSSRVSVLQAESKQSIIYRGAVGQVMPLNAGAAGKVFMAFDREAYLAAVEAGLYAYTSQTVVDTTLLDEQLAQTLRQGWSFSQEEREIGLNSVAAPVFGATGEVVAAVAVGGPSFRVTAESAKEFAALTLTCAGAISAGILGRTDASGRQNGTAGG